MKGINLKKIGAIVAGATILASSVAFAGGLMYQNTELVNENGEPLAKVILGAGSQAVDGVVSAAISNRMANEAYKSATLTAEVVGEATCSGSAEACGTCDIVEGSETVTLEITVPGAGVEGVHTFTTAIGDYVDRKLENRWNDPTDDDEAYLVFDDFEDLDANPFQNTMGSGDPTTDGILTNSEDLDGDDAKTLYKIYDENFAPFRDSTVMDSKSGKEYTEWEYFWVFGNDHWDESDQEIYGEVEYASYAALFDATGDYGIPVCPGDTDMDWTMCSDLDTLPAHKVYVHWGGEDWVISEIENIGGEATSLADTLVGVGLRDQEVYQIDNAKVSLAKEAVSGIINVGEIMEAPSGYKVRLDDISREVGMTNSHPAIITVLDANDNEICQDQVYPGETKDDLCDEATGVKLHVYQTAPGLNFIAKWAEMAIYKDEIELESDEDFLDDDNTEWKVWIGWTNKGDVLDGMTTGISPEYLREIMLVNPDPDDMDEMEQGEVFEVVDVSEYEIWDLTYNGLDDEDANYDTLKFKVEDDKDFSIMDGVATTCDLYFYNAIEVTTGEEFRINPLDMGTTWEGGMTDSKRGETMWYIPWYAVDGGSTTCGWGGNDLVVIKDSDGDRYLIEEAGAFWGLSAKYRHAGSGGFIVFYPDYYTGWYSQISLTESAGKWDNQDIVDVMGFGIDTDEGGSPSTAYTQFDLDENWLSPTPDEDYIGYVVADQDCTEVMEGFVGAGCLEPGYDQLGYTFDQTYEEKFISMRGTKFKAGSKSAYEFQVPGQQLWTSWTFSTVEAAESTPDTSTFTLHEGETAAVGTTGVSVHVLSIDQQLTPCSAGTGAGEAPACTPDMSTVSAVVMPNNAPSVETIVPYSLTSNLVYLDTDNVALDTGVIITVGGDAVNTVTKDAIAGSDVDFEATPVVVKQIGNKIVVAGLTGPDTAAAGEQFLSELTN